MSNFVALIKKYNRAWSTKDVDTLHEVLTSDCWFKGPGFNVKGAKALVEWIKDFVCSCENARWRCSKDGCTVVQWYDWVVTFPFSARIPICEWLTIENSKIKSSCICY